MVDVQSSNDETPALSTRPRWVVRRAARWTANVVAVASATLAVGLVSLWVRSHYVTDSWSVTGTRSFAVRTARGRVMLERERRFAGHVVAQWPLPAGAAAVTADPGGVVAPLLNILRRVDSSHTAFVTSDTVAEQPTTAGRVWAHESPDAGWPRWHPPARYAFGVGWEAGNLMRRFTVQQQGGSTVDVAGHEHFSGFYHIDATVVTYGVVQLSVPLWLATTAALLLPAVRVGQAVRGGRHPPGHCKRCGYDLRASPDRCPECGQVMKTGGAGG